MWISFIYYSIRMKEKIYQVYFENTYDPSENKEWYYRSEDKADKKYGELCKKYNVKHSFCFTDQDWYYIWYSEIHIED